MIDVTRLSALQLRHQSCHVAVTIRDGMKTVQDLGIGGLIAQQAALEDLNNRTPSWWLPDNELGAWAS